MADVLTQWNDVSKDLISGCSEVGWRFIGENAERLEMKEAWRSDDRLSDWVTRVCLWPWGERRQDVMESRVSGPHLSHAGCITFAASPLWVSVSSSVKRGQ